MDLKEQFRDPGAEYRGVPFWSLNDDLQADELVWQIREMKEQGMGGYFLHPRVGLITPYMSNEWLDLIGRCADEARATGTYAWLYDEDRWPSGFAGGMVPARGMEYRQKFLKLVEFDVRGGGPKVEKMDGLITVNGHTNIINWFACRKVDGRIEDLRQLPVTPDHTLPDGTHILLFRKEIHGDSVWHNGYAYVDTLDPKVIDAFIESTYEPYRKKLGDRFGREVPGIFTDEPNIAPMSWTERLPEEFEKGYGYDILEHLPSLFYEVGDWQRVRHDYRSLTADMFVEAYGKKLYEWCDKSKLEFTGHYLAEDTLVSQLERAGACMPLYEYMHMPGIDHLFRRLQDITLVKQVSSVANQLGRKRVLSETFGGSGWNMSFADQKWIANWQLALGVNFMNQHLSLYSARGRRKRDWPPSIFHQQPYWDHYKWMSDYLARACLMLTQGNFIADVLLIHPIASAWCVYSPHDKSKAQTLADAFKRTSMNLAQLHREFEYGDEKLMARYAQVDGKRLVVGRMKYRVVVIPASVTLASTTLRLLKEFLAAGGTVIMIRPTPVRVDGREDVPDLQQLLRQKCANLVIINDDKQQLGKALESTVSRGISVRDDSGSEAAQVVVHRRQDGKRHIVFLANTDLERGCDVLLTVDASGELEEWNLEAGTTARAAAHPTSRGLRMKVSLPGAGSKLFVIDESRKFTPVEEKPPAEVESVQLGDGWVVRRHSPNSLLLDMCSYRIGGGEWTGPVPVFKVQQTMEGQPDGTEVGLRFTFEVGFTPDGSDEMFLVFEQPSIYNVRFNGEELKFEDAGWLVDKSFRKTGIAELVRRGENVVEMTCRFERPTKPGTLKFVKDGVELESIYIVGDFAVEAVSVRLDGPMGTSVAEGGFKLVREGIEPKHGDLIAAGYPFFAGEIELAQTVDIERLREGQAYLELDGLHAIVAEVKINGRQAGALYWQPYRMEITNHLKRGRNWVVITLSNSLRNLLGAHHHKAGELYAASPHSFTDGGNWTDAYHFVKLGIPGTVRIRWEK